MGPKPLGRGSPTTKAFIAELESEADKELRYVYSMFSCVSHSLSPLMYPVHGPTPKVSSVANGEEQWARHILSTVLCCIIRPTKASG